MKQILILGLIAAVLIGGYLFLRGDQSEDVEPPVLDDYSVTNTIDSDQTLREPLTIVAGEATVLKGDAILTAEADLTIDGALGCEEGSLTLVTSGRLVLNDTIVCQGESGGNVTIIAEGGIEMSNKARIVASGNVQLVDDRSLTRSSGELDTLYDGVTEVPESGIAVGPFLDDDVPYEDGGQATAYIPAQGSWWPLVSVAHAQIDNGTTTVNLTAQPIRVSGMLKVETPTRKGVKRIVVFDFPNTPEVTISDFELEGPNGRAGDSETGSCNVTGDDGEDAFRFNAFAPNLIVNNFTLSLGDGGAGGEATTGNDCELAKAEGGDGGKPGNFRMIGSEKFEIRGAFMIHPGNGGTGGGATATGKKGDPSEPGGDADATGGDGADNKKKLSVMGTVAGTGNVQFGDAVGGHGGSVLAEGGDGGDADECGEKGGDGGKATARSGAGGDAKLTVTGGASRMEFANDIGGKGGIMEAYGGQGGAGGSCDETAKGGDGGNGGDASGTPGLGGIGKSGRAPDGAELGNDGGDGGNGGDGCTEGIGGDGGSGEIEDGERGEDGQNICITITKEEDYVSLVPGEVQVIQYGEYYLRVESLGRFTDDSGEECDGAEHWHPSAGNAVALDGGLVPDPDPVNCGYGKTSEVPILIMEDPNYVDEDMEAGVQGGGMIQIEPPTLVIPAQ